jgi:two-component system, NarL family, sensor kinase
LPAAVEVAAYLIALEALTNSRRHAQARTCTIRLSFDQAAGMLRLEVTDDGRGIRNPEPAAPGVGLASMRERAAELGGTCTITTPPTGGTHLVAELPCTNLQPAAAAAVQPLSRR